MFARKFFMAVITMIIAALPQICAANIYDYPRAAVIPFTKKAAISPDINWDDQINVTGIIYDELFNTGKFDLLDREYLQEIIDEQMLQMQMGNPASMVQTLNLEGAEYLLVGSIDGLSSKKRVGEAFGFGSNSYIVVARLSCRMIDVETSRVVLTARSVAESKVRLTKAPLRIIRIGENEINGDLVSDALEKAAVALVKNLMINMERRK
ncbi:MAG: hypothetical protein IJT73_11030 [Selenomonadaceae bacterium]|nr:hypothetical protein [Selenomonadaceae bacterium]